MDPIFILDGGFQLFWAAFDPILAVAPLKYALGLKTWFLGFKKKQSDNWLSSDYDFLNTQKSI